ncbi:unnamed protein product [Urochloa humidicola]
MGCALEKAHTGPSAAAPPRPRPDVPAACLPIYSTTMSPRRRVLNLVLRNKTGVHSLFRFNLLSRHNSLFYPTAKAAEDAAAAKDPNVLFADENDLHDHPAIYLDREEGSTAAEESLEKVEEMRVPPPALSFEPAPPWRKLDCAALSDTRTVFIDRSSRSAFLYDAGHRRVVTMPGFPERQWVPWRRAYFPFPAAGDKGNGDVVYAIDRDPLGEDDAANWLKFQAMAYRRGGSKRWHADDLLRPPFVDGVGYRNRNTLEIVSYAVAGADTICVSTEGRGTHCFDTASRAWSKAGDWALPFDGKVEHDRELGVWLGFVKQFREVDVYEDDDTYRWNSLYATSDLLADVDRRWLITYSGDEFRHLWPPPGWHKVELLEPQVAGLGSGKFCVTQFFETRSACSKCFHEDADKRFAVFTGVEVVRGGTNGSDEKASNGSTEVIRPTELQLIIHKSKRYMLTMGNTIEYVL